MLTLLKYIVIFIFAVNITTVSAADVTLDIKPDPAEIVPVSGRLDLPHALSMRDFINQSTDSSVGKLIILGKYFDEKYPGDLINRDFSADVAVIFPELSPQEVYDQTKLIRNAVRLYRWGKQKYADIKASFLVPEEPPIMADENDFDQPQNYRYLETEDGKFVLVEDFTKVLSYGSNPRDVKAREAYQQRLADSKKQKTDFDKFKSMVAKLEFSKLPFYGVSLPNPLVGNAGVGPWQNKDGFKVRLISEMANINSLSQFTLAVHVDIPSHLFILANNLPGLSKPQFEIVTSENIKSYNFFYPLPVKFTDEKMIAAYAGDPAFPITIETENPDLPITLKAKFSFEACDNRMICKPYVFYPELVVEHGEDNISSGMQNFIKQSLYNLPQTDCEDFTVTQIIPLFNADNPDMIDRLDFTFEFDGKVNNFALFVESSDNAYFDAPQIIIGRHQIKASVKAHNLQYNSNIKIQLTARLNQYTSLNRSFNLNELQNTNNHTSQPSAGYLTAVYVGLLFWISSCGLALFFFKIYHLTNRKKLPSLIASACGVFVGCNAFTIALKLLQGKHFIFGEQYLGIGLLTFMVIMAIASISTLNYKLKSFYKHTNLSGFVWGLFTAWIIPWAAVKYSDTLFDKLMSVPYTTQLILLNILAACIALPYLITAVILYFAKSPSMSPKIQALCLIAAVLSLAVFILRIIGVIIVQLSFMDILKWLLIIIAVWLLLKYAFNFLQALYQTDLPKNQKQITEHVIYIIIAAAVLGASFIANRLGNYRFTEEATIISSQLIDQKISAGKTVIVALTPPWCIVCRFNDYLTFNANNLKRWQELYNLEYIPFNITKDSPEVAEYMQYYDTHRLPLYIMYNFNTLNGLRLPDFMTDSELEQILDNFKI